jgi:hypothetical protein
MIRSIRAMLHADLRALDGGIGRCQDFLFDDSSWTIRYMVADTRKWLPGRKVLISPSAVGDWDWQTDAIPVRLDRDAIKACPPLTSDMPVSRQYEVAIAAYYQWPTYWQGPHLWGGAMSPLVESTVAARPLETIEKPGESHLRSVKEVSGYHIQAVDDTAGHVDDFLLERDTWAIRYLVVDTRNWLPGRKVLISPAWADTIDWKRNRINVGMHRTAIETSPVYDPEHGPPSRDEETALHRHYDFKPYWWDGA